MAGSFAIAETYIRIDDGVPTQRTLERRAAQLEEYVRSVGVEVFGRGLIVEVLVEPGSIVERCKVYLEIGAAVIAILGTDYSLVKKNVDELYQASKSFSEQIVQKVLPDHPASPQHDESDRSAIVTRRNTLTLGKLKRTLDAAQELEYNPKSGDLLREFQHRLSLLLADCDDASERAQVMTVLEQDPPSHAALLLGFGKAYAKLVQSPPDSSLYVLRYYGKSAKPAAPHRKRATAAEKRTLPKPVVRRFSL